MLFSNQLAEASSGAGASFFSTGAAGASAGASTAGCVIGAS